MISSSNVLEKQMLALKLCMRKNERTYGRNGSRLLQLIGWQIILRASINNVTLNSLEFEVIESRALAPFLVHLMHDPKSQGQQTGLVDSNQLTY